MRSQRLKPEACVLFFCVLFFPPQQILNCALDDIEIFVARLQKAAEAFSQLNQRNKSKKNKKKGPAGLSPFLLLWWQGCSDDVGRIAPRCHVWFYCVPRAGTFQTCLCAAHFRQLSLIIVVIIHLILMLMIYSCCSTNTHADLKMKKIAYLNLLKHILNRECFLTSAEQVILYI